MGTTSVNVINNIQINKSLVTTKGDLIVGTGSGTVDVLPVGTDTYCIIADSSTATGLNYGIPMASYAFIVGGFNNSDNSFGTRINKLSGDVVCNSLISVLCVSCRGMGAATLSSSAYYAGGYTTAVWRSIYKITNDVTYGAISATISTSRYCDAGVLSASAYFTGGNVTTNNVIDKLTNDTTCAAVAAVLSATNQQGQSCGVLSASMYILGGKLSTPTYFNNIDKLTDDTTCAVVSAVLSVSSNQKASATLSSSLYCLGGYGSSYMNTINKLTNDTTCGAVTAVLSYSNASARATTLSSSLYYIGGITAGANYSSYGISKLTNDTTCSAVTARLWFPAYDLAVTNLAL